MILLRMVIHMVSFLYKLGEIWIQGKVERKLKRGLLIKTWPPSLPAYVFKVHIPA